MRNYDFRNGVYLDSCPNGHGIWLDRGELEIVHRIRQAAGELTREERQAMASAFAASTDKMIEISGDVRKFSAEQSRHRIDAQSDYSGGDY